MDNETRIIIKDYLNDMLKEEELLNIAELKKCDVCGSYELEEDMTYHKWDLGQDEPQICEDCLNNEDGLCE